MKVFLADTNFYLRFILQDVKSQAAKVEWYLKEAENDNVQIIFTSEVILEMAYVLISRYSFTQNEIFKALSVLVKTPFLEIEDRSLWLSVLETFKVKNISLLDILLSEKARNKGAEILSFDKDFQKLAKMK